MEALEISTGRLLAKERLTIACAESCTGGLLTSRLTDVAGSSAYVKGSIVSYSNEIKERLVGVKSDTLAGYGAVSEQTAGEMAEGIRRAIGADIGVGVTGIAGPDGGTPQKPVGLVYIAVAGAQGTVIRENRFKGTRGEIKLQTTETALEMIKNYISAGGIQ
ncbi:MAG TPA: competence protein ComA [Selenomonas sp.]|nr:competence protein ComA [Selenomonas sp.]